MQRVGLFVLSAIAASALPMQTFSAVCPAVEFYHDWKEVGSDLKVAFKPRTGERFDFVILHVALHDKTTGNTIGRQVDVPMYQDGSVFEGSLFNEWGKKPNTQLKYSFTYCVFLGQPVDCDTEHFEFEDPLEFQLSYGSYQCPTQCGQQEQYIEIPVKCVGSDSKEYPMEMCSHLERAAPVLCPATGSCVRYYWQEKAVTCPTTCGMPATTVKPRAECFGTDGRAHPGMCAHLPMPPAHTCPATQPCVTYYWKDEQVSCPTDCGMPATMVQAKAICMGSDGNIHHGMCNNLSRAPSVNCPATQPCVSYFWRAQRVDCPTECGMEATVVDPEAVCAGSDGSMAGDTMCQFQPRPPAVTCPETEPCGYWRAGSAVCSTECGLPATTITPEAMCVDTSGNKQDDSYCGQMAAPEPISCPATAPCQQPAQAYIRQSQVQVMQQPAIPACGGAHNPCFVKNAMVTLEHRYPTQFQQVVVQTGRKGKHGHHKHGPPPGPPGAGF